MGRRTVFFADWRRTILARTLLGRRTTHVVQPFLSQIWGYRQSDLSAKELNTKASELWLFHGTREFAAECITENEFQACHAGGYHSVKGLRAYNAARLNTNVPAGLRSSMCQPKCCQAS
ncbi:unnamed protein product [Effrenium voratum]|nr:unnamed protein product [Effrenium voratum]